jgi:hypothetical protein
LREVKVINKQKNRNAASDLVCLGLAAWQSENLVPTYIFTKSPSNLNEFAKDAIIRQALETDFIKELQIVIKENNSSPLEIGQKLAGRLNRKWTENSAIRYAGAGRSWLNFIDSSNFK